MESAVRGQTLKIFFADGHAEGLRVVEKSNWIGKALACSRSQFHVVKERPEFQKPGVYVIYGEDSETFQLKLYVGEGDPTLKRIESHLREKDFWSHLILFTSKDESLNKAHIQYLESRLVSMAQSAKRCRIENGNSPALPALSESDLADMESFLDNMLLVYGALGLSVFESPMNRRQETALNAQQLILKSNGADARGYDSVEGFVVIKGSRALMKEVPSIPQSIRLAREQLIKDGLLIPNGSAYELAQDYLFSSPSKAAGIMLGRSANGRVEWKDASGATLSELEEGLTSES
ncbi:MAG: GIY-YIG nuclease family protein [Bdellovibrionales bacterium]|nr:GIY-YIG nuclease family protein [Bdellovibrionales bacterium]